jgi:hypothetical protein
VELSADVLELLRRDDEFLLPRDKPWSVLLAAPVSTRRGPESLRVESLRLESLRIIEHYSHRQTTLLLHAQEPPEFITGTLLSGTIIADLSEYFSKGFVRWFAAGLTNLHCSAAAHSATRKPETTRGEA